MFWRKAGGKEYLTKKSSTHSKVTSLGVKNDESIKIYEDFIKSKRLLKEELSELKKKMQKSRKLNKIELLTRVPSILIDIFQKINELNLDDKMILIGTNTLYAYESHCAVFVEDEQLATDDIDLLTKQDKKLSVIFREVLPKGKFQELLHFIDNSFEQDKNVPYRFRNKEGVLLEVINPTQVKDAITTPKKEHNFSDVLELTMDGMQWLENSRIFKSMVIGDNGKCAIITTIHPLEFAVYKNWLSKQKNRDIIKKSRDYQQCQLVTQLIKEHMVNIDIVQELHEMRHFKKSVIQDYRKVLKL